MDEDMTRNGKESSVEAIEGTEVPETPSVAAPAEGVSDAEAIVAEECEDAENSEARIEESEEGSPNTEESDAAKHKGKSVDRKKRYFFFGLLNFLCIFKVDYSVIAKDVAASAVEAAFNDRSVKKTFQEIIQNLETIKNATAPYQAGGENPEEGESGASQEVSTVEEIQEDVLEKLWSVSEQVREQSEQVRKKVKSDDEGPNLDSGEKKTGIKLFEKIFTARAYFRESVKYLIFLKLGDTELYRYDPYKKCIDQLFWLAFWHENRKKETTRSWKCNEIFRSLIEILFPESGKTLRASSLLESCGSFHEERKALIRFSKRAKKEFVFFLSAISKNGQEDSTEYKVAKKLAEAFREHNIKYFWWEDATDIKLSKKGKTIGEKLRPSTKIAAGLAFSSVFIGLAFDGAQKDPENAGKYKFSCFDNENFRYETDVFLSLMGGVLDGNSIEKADYAKGFTRGIVGEFNFKKYVPQRRHYSFFTYGDPTNYKEYKVNNTQIAYFDNSGNKRLNIVSPEKGGEERKIDSLAQQVYDKIIDLIARDEELRQLCGIKIQDPAKIKESLRYVFSEQREKEKGDSAIKELYLPYQPCQKVGRTAGNSSAAGKIDIPEDAEAIPSDYFFEYAVTDEYGFSAKEHFTFFPESYYDKNGEIRWRIKAVIKDWNYAFIEHYKREKKELGEQEQRELSLKYPLVKFKKASSYLLKEKGKDDEVDVVGYEKYKSKENNCAIRIWDEIDSEGSWSGIVGKIKLEQSFEDKPDQSKEDKLYYFNVIFAPKKIIHYRIENTPDNAHVLFDIDGDIGDIKDIEVKVASRDGQLARFSDDRIVFTGTIGGLVAKQRKDGFNSGKNYSLRPYGESEKYYIFLDDTIYTGKGASAHQKVDRAMSVRREKRCPFCGRYLTSDDKLRDNPRYCYPRMNGKFYCQHSFVHQYWSAEKGEDFIVEINDRNSIRLDEKNRLLLPNDIKKNRVMAVSIVGDTQSGKSTFISSLFRTGAEIPDLNQIGNKLYPYVGKTEFVGLESKEQSGSSVREVTGGLSKQMLLSYYNVRPYREFVAKTSNTPNKNPVIAQVPYIMRLDRLQGTSDGAYLSFFDAPGSVFIAGTRSQVMKKETDPTMLFLSDCIILLINATPEKQGNKQFGLEKATEILRIIIARMETSGTALADVPLAIVLCKFDEFARKFDHNSYVRIQSPAVKGNKFCGSLMQTYIDRCSVEIEALIRTANNSDEFMKSVEKFSNRKFFAVSSIGRKDSIVSDNEQGSNAEYRTVYYSEPKHIEHVLLWLMYKAGVIV